MISQQLPIQICRPADASSDFRSPGDLAKAHARLMTHQVRCMRSGTADNPRMDVLEQIFRDYGHTPADYVVDEKLRNAGSAENAKRILIRK